MPTSLRFASSAMVCFCLFVLLLMCGLVRVFGVVVVVFDGAFVSGVMVGV
jgi:hypothetical protein